MKPEELDSFLEANPDLVNIHSMIFEGNMGALRKLPSFVLLMRCRGDSVKTVREKLSMSGERVSRVTKECISRLQDPDLSSVRRLLKSYSNYEKLEKAMVNSRSYQKKQYFKQKAMNQ